MTDTLLTRGGHGMTLLVLELPSVGTGVMIGHWSAAAVCALVGCDTLAVCGVRRLLD